MKFIPYAERKVKFLTFPSRGICDEQLRTEAEICLLSKHLTVVFMMISLNLI